MQIQETQVSVTRCFEKMLRKHFPSLIRLTSWGIGKGHGWTCLNYGVKGGLFNALKLLIGIIIKDDRLNLKFCVDTLDEHGEMFKGGVRHDLIIRVYDGGYLEDIKLMATEYEQETGKKVTLVKEF